MLDTDFKTESDSPEEWIYFMRSGQSQCNIDDKDLIYRSMS